MQKMSGAMFPFWALAVTFASFDWVMSLDYTWFSTIFGAYIFAGCVVSGYSLIVIITRRLQSMGLMKEVNSEHFHDAGKMMFAFVVLCHPSQTECKIRPPRRLRPSNCWW
jgi:hypothetical protein